MHDMAKPLPQTTNSPLVGKKRGIDEVSNDDEINTNDHDHDMDQNLEEMDY